MDDILQNFLKEGMRQLVILGAGYDSHSYRFALKDVKTFEVDHPATQRDNLEKVQRIFGKLPDHVCYMPVDFNSENVADRLLQSGYDSTRKILFIW